MTNGPDSDNYDVNDAAFIATKKTLIRLSTLASYPVDVNLWMPVPGAPNHDSSGHPQPA